MTELEELRKQVKEKETRERIEKETRRLKEKLEEGTLTGNIKKGIKNFWGKI